MKRFKFSLESVLALRHFRKMEAAGVLAEASKSRQRASGLLKKERGQLKSLEKGFLDAISPSGTAAELQRIQGGLIRQREIVAELKSAYVGSLEREAKARKEVLEAQREYKALVKLENRQRERALKEAHKEDERRMQEFVSARHVLVKGG